MAAYISIPRDLTRVKTKAFFGLTKRQLVCFGTAAIIGVPAFFLMRGTGNTSLAVMGMILLMLPLFFLAMYEKDGQPLEVVARHFIQAKFIRPKIRPYATNNYYSALMRQDQVEKEVHAIVRNAEKRQRENAARSRHTPGRSDKGGAEAGPGHRGGSAQG